MKIIIDFTLKIMSSFNSKAELHKDMEFALDLEFVPNHQGLERLLSFY